MADANGAAQAVANQQQPGGAPSPAQVDVSGKVDLSSHPQFREWQRSMDQKLAEASARQRELEQQLQAMQTERQRDELAEIRALDPEERAARLEALYQRQQEEQRKAAISAEATTAIQQAGLQWNDPRLSQAIALGPTEKGLNAVYRSITAILAEERQKATETAQAALELERQKAAQQAQVAATRGQQAALVEAGVLTTSTAAPVVQPVDQTAAALTALRARYAKFRGSNADVANPAFRRLMDDARAAGYSMGDLA